MEILAKIEDVGAQINAEIQDVGLNVNVTVEGRNGYEIGDGLKIDRATNTISVDKAEAVVEGDGRPVTAGAVKQYVSDRIPDTVSKEEIECLKGASSNLQTQINGLLPRKYVVGDSTVASGFSVFSKDESERAGIGGYAPAGGNVERIYLGIGPSPWDANVSLLIYRDNIKFLNKQVYYGDKLPPQIAQFEQRIAALESAMLATMLEGGSADVL